MRVHALNNISFEIWIMYYLILGIIQALWTNPYSFPPEPLRIAMIAAVFGPVVLRREIILFAIPYSMTLRGFWSTQYSYLPDIWSYEYYLGIIILSMVVHMRTLNFSLYGKVKPLIAMMLYFAIVDVLSNGEVGNYAIHIFIGLLLVPFIKREYDFHLLSAAIIAASAILAIYYIIMFDEFLFAWVSPDLEHSGLERSGWSDPNYFAIMLDRGLLVAIMYFGGFCKSNHSFFNKIILGTCCLIIAAAVFMTASRAGFLCIAFIFIISIFAAKINFWHFLLTLLVVTAACAYMYNRGAIDILLIRLFEETNIATGGGRTEIWQLMLRNFGGQDFGTQLIGGGYWYRVKLTWGADLHNEFLSIMADYGLIGLSLFVSFFFSIVSLRAGNFWKQNIAVIFYFLSVISLSPFQYVYILFLIVWIYALKFNNDGILIPEENE